MFAIGSEIDGDVARPIRRDRFWGDAFIRTLTIYLQVETEVLGLGEMGPVSPTPDIRPGSQNANFNSAGPAAPSPLTEREHS